MSYTIRMSKQKTDAEDSLEPLQAVKQNSQ